SGGGEVRLRGRSRPLGRHAHHLGPRVGRCRRPRVGGRRLAVAARLCARAVPDLRQRAVALRAAPRRRGPRLSGALPRPDPRPPDAGAMTSTRRALVALALLALLALIGAACTKAPADPASDAATGGSAEANHDQAVTFAECMRSHGVSTFPDPDGSGS